MRILRYRRIISSAYYPVAVLQRTSSLKNWHVKLNFDRTPEMQCSLSETIEMISLESYRRLKVFIHENYYVERKQ